MFEGLLKRLFGEPSLEEIVKEEVAKECGIDKEKLPKVSYMPLPFIAKITNYGKMIIGKIVGAYDALKHKIFVDPFDYFSSSLYEKVKILAEEFYHAADNLRGRLKRYKSFDDYIENYNNDENEIRAKNFAERIAQKIVKSYKLNPFSLYF